MTTEPPLDPLSRKDVLRAIRLWTLVCTVSAAPSFVVSLWLGATWDRAAAMVAGIIVFIAVYSRIYCLPTVRRLRRIKIWHNTFRAVYGTRLALSIAFPLGVYLDLVFGMLTAVVMKALEGSDTSIFTRDTASLAGSFTHTFVWTMLQGGLINLVLAVYMLVVFGLFAMFMRNPWEPVAEPNACPGCGYDLRASIGTCPECGHPIPPGMGAGDSLRPPATD
jgi:hypothetical protein